MAQKGVKIERTGGMYVVHIGHVQVGTILKPQQFALGNDRSSRRDERDG